MSEFLPWLHELKCPGGEGGRSKESGLGWVPSLMPPWAIGNRHPDEPETNIRKMGLTALPAMSSQEGDGVGIVAPALLPSALV